MTDEVKISKEVKQVVLMDCPKALASGEQRTLEGNVIPYSDDARFHGDFYGTLRFGPNGQQHSDT